MIYVGTSGFSYQDWVGVYYPQDLASRDWLSHYAREFDAVEINFSYYRMPTASGLMALADKVDSTFRFCIKANRAMTHEREELSAASIAFCEALRPWRERDCLGAVLAQFPGSFHNTPANQDYVRRLGEALSGLPVVIEFRHKSWLRRSVFAVLREAGLGICCVDQPQLSSLLPPFCVITSDVGYVRFHGRNGEKWFDHDHAWERYDYTYSAEELAPWVPRIREMDEKARSVYVMTNNHWVGQAIDTARQLRLHFGFAGE